MFTWRHLQSKPTGAESSDKVILYERTVFNDNGFVCQNVNKYYQLYINIKEMWVIWTINIIKIAISVEEVVNKSYYKTWRYYL